MSEESGCGDCGCGSTDNSQGVEVNGDLYFLQDSLADLLEKVSKNWSMALNEEQQEKWDVIFNDMGMKLANGNLSAFRVATIFQ
jgi:hypothetical protein